MKPYVPLSCFTFITLLSGCGERPTAPTANSGTSQEPSRVEVRLGEGVNRCLPFTISAIYEKQKPSKVSPFHVGGGEWTFFDCRAEADPQAVFTVGVKSKGNRGGQPLAWGQAVISVGNREVGGRFVELFGKAFGGKLPKPAEHPWALEPLFINTVILGENQKRQEGGGFSDSEGGWTATKWFPETDRRYGEVFLNYNLEKRLGEFREKDAEYADDLVAIFASALRDGSPSEGKPD
jgi:hypothetical protein